MCVCVCVRRKAVCVVIRQGAVEGFGSKEVFVGTGSGPASARRGGLRRPPFQWIPLPRSGRVFYTTITGSMDLEVASAPVGAGGCEPFETNNPPCIHKVCCPAGPFPRGKKQAMQYVEILPDTVILMPSYLSDIEPPGHLDHSAHLAHFPNPLPVLVITPLSS